VQSIVKQSVIELTTLASKALISSLKWFTPLKKGNSLTKPRLAGMRLWVQKEQMMMFSRLDEKALLRNSIEVVDSSLANSCSFHSKPSTIYFVRYLFIENEKRVRI